MRIDGNHRVDSAVRCLEDLLDEVGDVLHQIGVVALAADQMVGTAAVQVTRNWSSSSNIEAPSIFMPGITSAAPFIGAVSASPQQLA